MLAIKSFPLRAAPVTFVVGFFLAAFATAAPNTKGSLSAAPRFNFLL